MSLQGWLSGVAFESAAISPSFFTLARSFAFLSGSIFAVPGREGAASFFASGLPSLPSSPLLLSPSFAPWGSFALGGSGAFSGGLTW